jgi:isoleucyl-tRNA synthetase
MSKSLGNTVEPWDVIDRFGADALRWYLFTSKQPWDGYRFSLETIGEALRQFLLQLWNTYGFYVLYANANQLAPVALDEVELLELDRWALSRCSATVEIVRERRDVFDATVAGRAIASFVDELSNWYVRRSRRRFWDGDPAAFATLRECLLTVAKLLAPFCPFVADELHRNLTGSVPERQSGTTESVHLADWPTVDLSARDEALEAEMERARTVVSLGLSARMEAKLKVRRPLRRAFVLVPEGGSFSDAVAAEIADALNVKQLEAVTDLEGLLDYSVVPNFRALGPRAGTSMPLVKAALAGVDGADVRRAFESDGFYELALADGTTMRLGPDDVDVRAASHEELALAQEGGDAVALDTSVDDELLAEGLARDVVRLINDQRKAQGFEIADRITVQLAAGGRLGAAIHAHRDRIAADVLAVRFELLEELDGGVALDVDGEPLQLAITKA